MLYEMTGLTRTFKERQVLCLEHLAIRPHKIYTLIGANGAGKSTLLNLLAFLDRPTSGSLQFRGQPVRYDKHQLLELRRRVVLIDQYPILFTGSVWKNVEFGLKVRGLAKKLRTPRIEQALELVGMEGFRKADARTLSGGETKRVALARGLAIEPEVLLCDEPTANVDVENQEIILNILQKINRQHRTSIILATHYLAQSRRLADHTLMLEHGVLSDQGQENLYRCRVIRQDEIKILCRLAGQVDLELPFQQFRDLPKQCRLFIDPKKIRFAADRETGEGQIRLTGRVIRVEEENGRVRITMDCGIPLCLSLAATDYRQSPPLIGQKHTILLPPAALRFSPSGSTA